MTWQPLHMKPHPVWGQHVHLTCDIPSTNWCHHTHSIDNITHTLYDFTLAICVASFALYNTSHPRFMTSNHLFYDITPTIFDIVSTVSVSWHPLYWWYHTNWIFEISSAIYDDIISIIYDITATECVSSHQHFQRFNTLCMQDIIPSLCIISYTLYRTPRPHFMTSHHII